MSSVYDEINKAVSGAMSNVKKEYDSMCKKVIDLTAKEITMDLKSLYKKYIDDYYDYITKSYYRHDVWGKGTGYGVNLYKGDMISYNKSAKQITIRIKGDQMSPYRKFPADSVLDMIGNGIRPMGVVNGRFNSTRWESSYESDYFNTSATLNKAMDTYVAESPIIGYKIAKKHISAIKASGKYKYF